MTANYLDAIRSFEGFTPQATWDYAQHTNGYGTRAKYAGEVIDKAEADRRFNAEITEARAIVERHAPTASEGTKQALTSLTFNAGDKWTRSGLGDAVRSGDTEKARDLFLQYNKAGGEVLPGLVKRREAEAAWIGNPAGTSDGGQGPAPPPMPMVAALPDYGRASSPVARPYVMPSASQTEPVAVRDFEPMPVTTPVAQRTDEEAEAELMSQIRGAVSGYGGEARMTQLLLATKLIGAPSAADEKGDIAKAKA